MWAEIAGGACIILLGVIVKMQNTKIDDATTETDKKADKAMCDQRYGEVLTRLGRGVDRFDKIDDGLKKQRDILTKVHTIVENLDRNNGSRKVKK